MANTGKTIGQASAEGGADTLAGIDAMLTAWKDRDLTEFNTQMGDKNEILTNGDELEIKLYKDRDPGMISYADAYLKDGVQKTGILVVGAGHMVGDTGIIQGLKNLGYTVELEP